jgi:pimeloyl-ACP methyl ester carboxylesterase
LASSRDNAPRLAPFTVEFDARAVDDLRRRLAATRWPLGVTDSGGMPLAEVRTLTNYWRDGFDFEGSARRLNSFTNFKTRAGGLGVHFVRHARQTGAPPLLLLHGWPGSFTEMLAMIPLLEAHFEIVVPSLPGYGFSDPPVAAGMTNRQIAHVCAELMSQLGHERFFVQGGDWGAGIATWLARDHPQRLLGMHLNYIPGSFAPDVHDLTEEEHAFVRSRDEWIETSFAYGHVQRTRPLTLAYSLSDSPAGLAAWIAEKFREWADPACVIPVDDLLTNITLYWMTNTIASSVRLYLESVNTPHTFARGERVPVPCAVARFPFEAPFPPRSWIERVYNVRRWTAMPRGGHFAALEAPQLLSDDVIAFAREVS